MGRDLGAVRPASASAAQLDPRPFPVEDVSEAAIGLVGENVRLHAVLRTARQDGVEIVDREIDHEILKNAPPIPRILAI